MSVPRELFVAVTDLAAVDADAGADLPRLPALESLLARAERVVAPADWRRWVLEELGFERAAGELPIAVTFASAAKLDATDRDAQVAADPMKEPLVFDKLPIAREVFEADRIVNLPNMKVHYATGITLALKNMKGVLVGNAKRRCHEAGLDKAIVDLNNTIRPDLNVVDAISCMERMGPRGGDVVRMDLLLAGEDPAEVDCVGCAVMGHGLDEVRHLKRSVDARGIDPAGIETAGERVGDVRRPFRKAALSNAVIASSLSSSSQRSFSLSGRRARRAGKLATLQAIDLR